MALPVRAAQMDGVLICQCSRRGQTGPVPTRKQTTLRGKRRSMMAGPNQDSIKARVNSNRHQDNNHRTHSNSRGNRTLSSRSSTGSGPVNTLRSNHRTHSNRRVSRSMASNSTVNSLLRHRTARNNSTPSRITACPTALPAV